MTRYWAGANNGIYGKHRVGRYTAERDLQGAEKEKKVWNLKVCFSACPCEINASTVRITSSPDSTKINVKEIFPSVFY